MSGGFAYGEPEPKERCPYCNALCCADFVDVGVGMVQCGPYHCEACGASEIGPYEIGPYDDEHQRTERERKTGWYEPGSPPGSSANVDADGHHIRYFEADTLYRESCGVAPRYDRYGRFIGDKT